MVLEDLLRPGLRLVICGSAAGHRSASLGHYYAGRGNKFWRTLHEIGLTGRQLAPAEYRSLLSSNIGLTDLVKSQSGGDEAIDFGRDHGISLRQRIENHRPRYLCFNGKRAAKEFFGSREVSYGFQTELIGNTQLFVAPSTSAAANGSWNISRWQQLANHVLGVQHRVTA